MTTAYSLQLAACTYIEIYGCLRDADIGHTAKDRKKLGRTRARSETQARQALNAAIAVVNARLDLLASMSVGSGSAIILVVEEPDSTDVILLESSSKMTCTTEDMTLTQAPGG